MAVQQRIAFLCHPYHRGGVTRWMADAANAYCDMGWEVYFVTVEPRVVFFSGEGRETLLQLVRQGQRPVQTVSVKAGRAFEFGTQAYRAFVYRKLLVGLPPGTPVILSDDATVWEAACPLHATYPVVGVLHADEPYYYALARRHYQDVSVLVCVSERVKKTVIADIPDIDAGMVYAIPCGINLPAATGATGGGNILQLVYVGRITEYQKRVGDLVNICALLQQKNTAFRLSIIGDGMDRASLEQKFEDEGLSGVVTFCGWQSQAAVYERLAGSDILLLTSDFEGTPIAMMEALAAGCGLTGTRVSGIEDYELQPPAADCIRLYEPGNIAEAVAKTLQLAAVPTDVRRKAARQLAEREFSMQGCLEKYAAAIAAIKKTAPQKPATPAMPVQALIYSRAIAAARALKMSLRK